MRLAPNCSDEGKTGRREEMRSATGEKMREVMYFYMKNPEVRAFSGKFRGFRCVLGSLWFLGHF